MERQYHHLNLEQFSNLIVQLGYQDKVDATYLFERYQEVLEIYDMIATQNPSYALQSLDNIRLILYILNDYFYRIEGFTEIEPIIQDDAFIALLVNSVVDKYAADVHFKHDSKRLMSQFYPPISTINVFTNFILKKLELFKKQEPNKTLIIDMLNKSFSLVKAITTLLVNGFETEAFTTWRTMHELEATLIVLTKYGAPVILGYLQHMRYADAFNQILPTEICDSLFIDIKNQMKDYDLKSKDTKRFIEYGWLRFIPETTKDNLKLNFRDGLEVAAGLQEYNKVYQMASEVNHSSPLLIYSRREYFAMVTIVHLYDSFFRLENVFRFAYFSLLSDQEKAHYDQVRLLYYSEMKKIQQKESERYQRLRKKAT